jgi:hypothetical protein
MSYMLNEGAGCTGGQACCCVLLRGGQLSDRARVCKRVHASQSHVLPAHVLSGPFVAQAAHHAGVREKLTTSATEIREALATVYKVQCSPVMEALAFSVQPSDQSGVGLPWVVAFASILNLQASYS